MGLSIGVPFLPTGNIQACNWRSIIKDDRNRCAFTDFTVDLNLAVMILHSVLDDGQTKAGTTGLLGMALIHPIETLKHLVLMFGRDTNTGIPHAQQHFTGLLCNGHFTLPPGLLYL